MEGIDRFSSGKNNSWFFILRFFSIFAISFVYDGKEKDSVCR